MPKWKIWRLARMAAPLLPALSIVGSFFGIWRQFHSPEFPYQLKKATPQADFSSQRMAVLSRGWLLWLLAALSIGIRRASPHQTLLRQTSELKRSLRRQMESTGSLCTEYPIIGFIVGGLQMICGCRAGHFQPRTFPWKT